MPSLHVTQAFNVIETLNDWIRDTLSPITNPSWLPSYDIYFQMPEQGITFPSFSVFHLPGSDSDDYQGRRGDGIKAMRSYGIMDVSCWVSRNNIDWLAQLLTMESMVRWCAIDSPAIQVIDYSTPGTPVTQNYKIEITGVEGALVSDDPNPDVQRKRFLIGYTWIHRSS